jgi:hypothetical protein
MLLDAAAASLRPHFFLYYFVDVRNSEAVSGWVAQEEEKVGIIECRNQYNLFYFLKYQIISDYTRTIGCALGVRSDPSVHLSFQHKLP